jgi:hypothetical protein
MTISKWNSILQTKKKGENAPTHFPNPLWTFYIRKKKAKKRTCSTRSAFFFVSWTKMDFETSTEVNTKEETMSLFSCSHF